MAIDSLNESGVSLKVKVIWYGVSNYSLWKNNFSRQSYQTMFLASSIEYFPRTDFCAEYKA